MIISLLLLLPVYVPLAWIDWYLFRQHYGRFDLLRQLLIVAVVATTVLLVHEKMQDVAGIWSAVLPPLLGYVILLAGFFSSICWRTRRDRVGRSA